MNIPRSTSMIIVADDSPLYRKLLQDTLTHQDYYVLTAKNGAEALAMVEKHQPVVLITDWEMPDITGIELCARVRSDHEFYTHVILLTSKDEKEHIIKGLTSGADDYLTKPFHEGELLARVGVGVRLAELHREVQTKNRLLEELALTDALTGLPNRRAFDNWITRAFHGARRHRFPLWIAVADLDHFKRINDTYGHETGNLVLRRFGGILKSLTREADICARIGGEEFIVALTHVDRDGVGIALERIRERIEREVFEWEGTTFTATASFGAACLHEGTPEFEQLFIEADSALYKAKERGRNCVQVAEVKP